MNERPAILLRPATLDEIVELRWRILRAGLPRDAAIFAGDDDPSARHWGAFIATRCVGCVTAHLNTWEAQPAWQIRGMATEDGFRGRGIGRDLLATFESAARHQRLPILWCNARTPAIPFYEKAGWQTVSDTFDIPTAGPHRRMIKPL